MNFQTGMAARLGISGVLEYKDKDGNVIGTTEIRGSLPLADIGMSVDEARELIESQPADTGTEGA